MAIYLGSIKIENMKLGNTSIKEVYLGSIKIYPEGSSPVQGIFEKVAGTSGAFHSVGKDLSGNIYFGSSNGGNAGIKLFQNETLSNTNIIAGNIPADGTWYDMDGNLWFGIESDGNAGIFKKNTSGTAFTRTTTPPTQTYQCGGVYNGNLYVGAYSNGVYKMDNGTGLFTQTSQTVGTFWRCANNSDGKLYFAVESGGLWVVNDNDTLTRIINTNTMNGSVIDKNGELFWAGLGQYVYKIVNNVATAIPINFPVGTTNINAYGAIRYNDRIFFYGQFGIYEYNYDTEQVDYCAIDSGMRSIYAAGIGQDGKLYMGGTYRLNTDINVFETTNILGSNFQIAVNGSDGTLYFGTDNFANSGIYKLV